MKTLYLDFETRSEADIKLGVEHYATHPSTQVLCACFWFDGQLRSARTELELEDLAGFLLEPDVILSAWNVAFEWRILKHVLGIDIPVERLRCTAALARSYNLPGSLGNCAAIMKLDQQKDETGKRFMLRVSRPLPRTQRKNGMFHEMTDECYEKLISYCEDDVKTELAIAQALDPLPEQEQKLFERDLIMNYETGVKLDIELCEAAHSMATQKCTEVNNACKETYGFSANQVSEIAEYTGLDNARASTIEEALKNPELPEDHRKLLTARQLVSNATPKKYKAALDMAVGDKAYGTMLFNGASQTGRWAGRVLQPQNFSRGSFNEYWVDEQMEISTRYIKEGRVKQLPWFKDEMDILKSTVRGIIAGPIAVCDYSAIEARVLAWLAGQSDVLDAFRKGLDLYKVAASQIYGKPYEDITKLERAIGKVCVLALGYQGGIGAFSNMASIYGVEVEEAKAKRIIKDWRKANSDIVQYWWECGEDAMEAVDRKERVGDFEYDGEFLHSWLPSGRAIRYYKPEIRHDKQYDKPMLTFLTEPSMNDKTIEKEGKFSRVSTYAGKLAQGRTQAVARDLMADAMLKLPEDCVCMTVHDEICSQKYELDLLKSAMLDTPSWAEGLPVAVDGFSAHAYRK